MNQHDVIEQKIVKDKERVEFLLNNGNFLDEDGYPTDDALEIIKKWHWDDIRGWFKFIEGIWHFYPWGWKEKDEPHQRKNLSVRRYYISTGGWSGNESIIHAMQENSLMWTLNWVQSNRGGHYIFEEYELNP